MSTRFDPLADDPLSAPPVAPVVVTAPKRTRRKPEAAAAASVEAPATPLSVMGEALRKVPDNTILFMVKGTPLEGRTAHFIRNRVLMHEDHRGPFLDWRKAIASLIESLAAPAPAPAEETVSVVPVPLVSIVQTWRDRLTFPIQQLHA